MLTNYVVLEKINDSVMANDEKDNHDSITKRINVHLRRPYYFDSSHKYGSKDLNCEEEAAAALLLAAGCRNANTFDEYNNVFTTNENILSVAQCVTTPSSSSDENISLRRTTSCEENENSEKNIFTTNVISSFQNIPLCVSNNSSNPNYGSNAVYYVSPASSGLSTNNDNRNEIVEDRSLSHFPTQLHSVLSHPDYAATALEWLPHGRSWRVLRWEALQSNTLQKLFPQCVADPDTFTRLIYAWGFKEIRNGADRGSFQHSMFLRGRPDLCNKMTMDTHGTMCEKFLSSRPNEGSSKTNVTSSIHAVRQVYSTSGYEDAPPSSSPPQLIRNIVSGNQDNSNVVISPLNDDQNVFRQKNNLMHKCPEVYTFSSNGIDNPLWVRTNNSNDNATITGRINCISANVLPVHTVSNPVAPFTQGTSTTLSSEGVSPGLSSRRNDKINQINQCRNKSSSVKVIDKTDTGEHFDSRSKQFSIGPIICQTKNVMLWDNISNEQMSRSQVTAIKNPPQFQRDVVRLQSNRGRSRPSNHVVFDHASKNHAKVFTVSSRGGPKRRVPLNKVTLDSSVANIDLLKQTVVKQENIRPIESRENPQVKETREENHISSFSSVCSRYPVAIAVSRKSKRVRAENEDIRSATGERIPKFPNSKPPSSLPF